MRQLPIEKAYYFVRHYSKPNEAKGLSTLDKWIRKELTVDVESELSKYKEKVKTLLLLTPSGEVIIKGHELTAKQKVLVYLIGKAYANIANYSESTVTNKELADALHLPDGTVKFSLFELRKEGLTLSVTSGVHQIRIASIRIAFEKYFGGENKN